MNEQDKQLLKAIDKADLPEKVKKTLRNKVNANIIIREAILSKLKV
jgi:hypothetical protein